MPPAPLPFTPPRALCLGRHVSDKGFDVALAALARLADRIPELRLVLAAMARRARASRRGPPTSASPAVRDFPGRVPDAAAAVNGSTFVIMPLALGGDIRAGGPRGGPPRPSRRWQTRVGALPEVVLDGETGLIAEREDDVGLAAAIAALLDDPERTRRMGRAARDRALTVFKAEQSLNGYEALYERFAQPATR